MRSVVALSLALLTGIFAFTAGVGLTGSLLGAALVSLLAATPVGLLMARRSITRLDEGACSPGLKVVSGLATLAAVVQLVRVAIFIVDPVQIGCSVVPTSKWEVQHSCLSAYFVSAQAAPTVPDLYDDALFTMPDDVPTEPRHARMLGPFKIDVYEYPPPYLLLPRVLLLLTPDFPHLRMLWFGSCGGVVLLAMLAVARSMSPAAGTRALLLSPLIWMALPTISTLQKGNVQVPVIAASMLAMLLFERRRYRSGGAILAFAAMSKIYPGMLVIYLVAQRRWHALAWTAAAGFAILAVSLLDTGWAPYAAFLHHLPGILGGEAFPAFRNPAAMAINFSIPGIVFKLKLFGVPGTSFFASKIVGWSYTLVVIGVTVLAARRTYDDDRKPLVWMAILILATLRSPFLPVAYAAVPPLWLLTLLAAIGAQTTRRLVMTLVACAALNVYWPNDWPVDPRRLAIVMLLPMAVTIAVAALALRRPPESESLPA